MSASAWHTVAATAFNVCWGAFALVWIVGTFYNARRSPAVRKRTLGDARWIAGAALVGVGLRFVPGSDWRHLAVHSQWAGWPGLVLLVASTAFTIWARFSLGTMWSSAVVARVGHQLRTDGPYRIVRHPIYTGLFGMVLGSALLDGLGRWTLALIAVAMLIFVKVRAEERLMTELFPNEYPGYRRRVPALVPLAKRF